MSLFILLEHFFEKTLFVYQQLLALDWNIFQSFGNAMEEMS